MPPLLRSIKLWTKSLQNQQLSSPQFHSSWMWARTKQGQIRTRLLWQTQIAPSTIATVLLDLTPRQCKLSLKQVQAWHVTVMDHQLQLEIGRWVKFSSKKRFLEAISELARMVNRSKRLLEVGIKLALAGIWIAKSVTTRITDRLPQDRCSLWVVLQITIQIKP